VVNTVLTACSRRRAIECASGDGATASAPRRVVDSRCRLVDVANRQSSRTTAKLFASRGAATDAVINLVGVPAPRGAPARAFEIGLTFRSRAQWWWRPARARTARLRLYERPQCRTPVRQRPPPLFSAHPLPAPWERRSGSCADSGLAWTIFRGRACTFGRGDNFL
jgi:hypothetical protein